MDEIENVQRISDLSTKKCTKALLSNETPPKCNLKGLECKHNFYFCYLPVTSHTAQLYLYLVGPINSFWLRVNVIFLYKNI